jgi:hypothetical protein
LKNGKSVCRLHVVAPSKSEASSAVRASKSSALCKRVLALMGERAASYNITALALVDGQGDCYNLRTFHVRASKSAPASTRKAKKSS